MPNETTILTHVHVKSIADYYGDNTQNKIRQWPRLLYIDTHLKAIIPEQDTTTTPAPIKPQEDQNKIEKPDNKKKKKKAKKALGEKTPLLKREKPQQDFPKTQTLEQPSLQQPENDNNQFGIFHGQTIQHPYNCFAALNTRELCNYIDFTFPRLKDELQQQKDALAKKQPNKITLRFSKLPKKFIISIPAKAYTKYKQRAIRDDLNVMTQIEHDVKRAEQGLAQTVFDDLVRNRSTNNKLPPNPDEKTKAHKKLTAFAREYGDHYTIDIPAAYQILLQDYLLQERANKLQEKPSATSRLKPGKKAKTKRAECDTYINEIDKMLLDTEKRVSIPDADDHPEMSEILSLASIEQQTRFWKEFDQATVASKGSINTDRIPSYDKETIKNRTANETITAQNLAKMLVKYPNKYKAQPKSKLPEIPLNERKMLEYEAEHHHMHKKLTQQNDAAFARLLYALQDTRRLNDDGDNGVSEPGEAIKLVRDNETSQTIIDKFCRDIIKRPTTMFRPQQGLFTPYIYTMLSSTFKDVFIREYQAYREKTPRLKKLELDQSERLFTKDDKIKVANEFASLNEYVHTINREFIQNQLNKKDITDFKGNPIDKESYNTLLTFINNYLDPKAHTIKDSLELYRNTLDGLYGTVIEKLSALTTASLPNIEKLNEFVFTVDEAITYLDEEASEQKPENSKPGLLRKIPLRKSTSPAEVPATTKKITLHLLREMATGEYFRKEISAEQRSKDQKNYEEYITDKRKEESLHFQNCFKTFFQLAEKRIQEDPKLKGHEKNNLRCDLYQHNTKQIKDYRIAANPYISKDFLIFFNYLLQGKPDIDNTRDKRGYQITNGSEWFIPAEQGDNDKPIMCGNLECYINIKQADNAFARLSPDDKTSLEKSFIQPYLDQYDGSHDNYAILICTIGNADHIKQWASKRFAFLAQHKLSVATDQPALAINGINPATEQTKQTEITSNDIEFLKHPRVRANMPLWHKLDKIITQHINTPKHQWNLQTSNFIEKYGDFNDGRYTELQKLISTYGGVPFIPQNKVKTYLDCYHYCGNEYLQDILEMIQRNKYIFNPDAPNDNGNSELLIIKPFIEKHFKNEQHDLNASSLENLNKLKERIVEKAKEIASSLPTTTKENSLQDLIAIYDGLCNIPVTNLENCIKTQPVDKNLLPYIKLIIKHKSYNNIPITALTDTTKLTNTSASEANTQIWLFINSAHNLPNYLAKIAREQVDTTIQAPSIFIAQHYDPEQQLALPDIDKASVEDLCQFIVNNSHNLDQDDPLTDFIKLIITSCEIGIPGISFEMLSAFNKLHVNYLAENPNTFLTKLVRFAIENKGFEDISITQLEAFLKKNTQKINPLWQSYLEHKQNSKASRQILKDLLLNETGANSLNKKSPANFAQIFSLYHELCNIPTLAAQEELNNNGTNNSLRTGLLTLAVRYNQLTDAPNEQILGIINQHLQLTPLQKALFGKIIEHHSFHKIPAAELLKLVRTHLKFDGTEYALHRFVAPLLHQTKLIEFAKRQTIENELNSFYAAKKPTHYASESALNQLTIAHQGMHNIPPTAALSYLEEHKEAPHKIQTATLRLIANSESFTKIEIASLQAVVRANVAPETLQKYIPKNGHFEDISVETLHDILTDALDKLTTINFTTRQSYRNKGLATQLSSAPRTSLDPEKPRSMDQLHEPTKKHLDFLRKYPLFGDNIYSTSGIAELREHLDLHMAQDFQYDRLEEGWCFTTEAVACQSNDTTQNTHPAPIFASHKQLQELRVNKAIFLLCSPLFTSETSASQASAYLTAHMVENPKRFPKEHMSIYAAEKTFPRTFRRGINRFDGAVHDFITYHSNTELRALDGIQLNTAEYIVSRLASDEPIDDFRALAVEQLLKMPAQTLTKENAEELLTNNTISFHKILQENEKRRNTTKQQNSNKISIWRTTSGDQKAETVFYDFINTHQPATATWQQAQERRNAEFVFTYFAPNDQLIEKLRLKHLGEILRNATPDTATVKTYIDIVKELTGEKDSETYQICTTPQHCQQLQLLFQTHAQRHAWNAQVELLIKTFGDAQTLASYRAKRFRELLATNEVHEITAYLTKCGFSQNIAPNDPKISTQQKAVSHHIHAYLQEYVLHLNATPSESEQFTEQPQQWKKALEIIFCALATDELLWNLRYLRVKELFNKPNKTTANDYIRNTRASNRPAITAGKRQEIWLKAENVTILDAVFAEFDNPNPGSWHEAREILIKSWGTNNRLSSFRANYIRRLLRSRPTQQETQQNLDQLTNNYLTLLLENDSFEILLEGKLAKHTAQQSVIAQLKNDFDLYLVDLKQGKVTWSYSTETLFRAFASDKQLQELRLFHTEELLSLDNIEISKKYKSFVNKSTIVSSENIARLDNIFASNQNNHPWSKNTFFLIDAWGTPLRRDKYLIKLVQEMLQSYSESDTGIAYKTQEQIRYLRSIGIDKIQLVTAEAGKQELEALLTKYVDSRAWNINTYLILKECSNNNIKLCQKYTVKRYVEWMTGTGEEYNSIKAIYTEPAQSGAKQLFPNDENDILGLNDTNSTELGVQQIKDTFGADNADLQEIKTHIRNYIDLHECGVEQGFIPHWLTSLICTKTFCETAGIIDGEDTALDTYHRWIKILDDYALTQDIKTIIDNFTQHLRLEQYDEAFDIIRTHLQRDQTDNATGQDNAVTKQNKAILVKLQEAASEIARKYLGQYDAFNKTFEQKVGLVIHCDNTDRLKSHANNLLNSNQAKNELSDDIVSTLTSISGQEKLQTAAKNSYCTAKIAIDSTSSAPQEKGRKYTTQNTSTELFDKYPEVLGYITTGAISEQWIKCLNNYITAIEKSKDKDINAIRASALQLLQTHRWRELRSFYASIPESAKQSMLSNNKIDKSSPLTELIKLIQNQPQEDNTEKMLVDHLVRTYKKIGRNKETLSKLEQSIICCNGDQTKKTTAINSAFHFISTIAAARIKESDANQLGRYKNVRDIQQYIKNITEASEKRRCNKERTKLERLQKQEANKHLLKLLNVINEALVSIPESQSTAPHSETLVNVLAMTVVLTNDPADNLNDKLHNIVALSADLDYREKQTLLKELAKIIVKIQKDKISGYEDITTSIKSCQLTLIQGEAIRINTAYTEILKELDHIIADNKHTYNTGVTYCVLMSQGLDRRRKQILLDKFQQAIAMSFIHAFRHEIHEECQQIAQNGIPLNFSFDIDAIELTLTCLNPAHRNMLLDDISNIINSHAVTGTAKTQFTEVSDKFTDTILVTAENLQHDARFELLKIADMTETTPEKMQSKFTDAKTNSATTRTLLQQVREIIRIGDNNKEIHEQLDTYHQDAEKYDKHRKELLDWITKTAQISMQRKSAEKLIQKIAELEQEIADIENDHQITTDEDAGRTHEIDAQKIDINEEHPSLDTAQEQLKQKTAAYKATYIETIRTTQLPVAAINYLNTHADRIDRAAIRDEVTHVTDPIFAEIVAELDSRFAKTNPVEDLTEKHSCVWHYSKYQQILSKFNQFMHDSETAPFTAEETSFLSVSNDENPSVSDADSEQETQPMLDVIRQDIQKHVIPDILQHDSTRKFNFVRQLILAAATTAQAKAFTDQRGPFFVSISELQIKIKQATNSKNSFNKQVLSAEEAKNIGILRSYCEQDADKYGTFLIGLNRTIKEALSEICLRISFLQNNYYMVLELGTEDDIKKARETIATQLDDIKTIIKNTPLILSLGSKEQITRARRFIEDAKSSNTAQLRALKALPAKNKKQRKKHNDLLPETRQLAKLLKSFPTDEIPEPTVKIVADIKLTTDDDYQGTQCSDTSPPKSTRSDRDSGSQSSFSEETLYDAATLALAGQIAKQRRRTSKNSGSDTIPLSLPGFFGDSTTSEETSMYPDFLLPPPTLDDSIEQSVTKSTSTTKPEERPPSPQAPSSPLGTPRREHKKFFALTPPPSSLFFGVHRRKTPSDTASSQEQSPEKQTIKTYQGRLNGQDVTFDETPLKNSDNCGYETLGIARQELATDLLSNIENQDIRALIAEEIANAAHDRSMQAKPTFLVNLARDYPFESLLEHCKTDDKAYTSYINECINGTTLLGIPNIIAYAQLNKIAVHIWEPLNPSNPNNNKIICNNSYTPKTEPEKTIHVIWQDRGHFNLINIQTPENELDPTPSTPGSITFG